MRGRRPRGGVERWLGREPARECPTRHENASVRMALMTSRNGEKKEAGRLRESHKTANKIGSVLEVVVVMGDRAVEVVVTTATAVVGLMGIRNRAIVAVRRMTKWNRVSFR